MLGPGCMGQPQTGQRGMRASRRDSFEESDTESCWGLLDGEGRAVEVSSSWSRRAASDFRAPVLKKP